MTIKQAIEKAIEGGWSPVDNFNEPKELGEMLYAEIFLDPLFWQSLGKAMGWRQDEDQWGDRAEWVSQWHRFIDHIADGGSAESFFENL